MDEKRTLTQEERNEYTAYFNLADLLGRSIQAAAYQIQHPEYSPELITWDPPLPPPVDEEEDEEPAEAADHNPATPAEDPYIHSGEGSVNDQINQIVAMHTPGLFEFLQPSALFQMYALATSQFSYSFTTLDPEQDLPPADKEKVALAWVIAKRVFAVRHPDETALIISATESAIREAKTIAFRPIDDTDHQFIVETCKLCLKVFKTGKSIEQTLEGMVQEFKKAEKAAQISRLAPLGSVPNGDSINWLYRVISNKGGRIVEQSNGNRHEQIIAQRKGDSLRFIRNNKKSGSSVIVEITQADKYLSKTNKTFTKTLLFALQKMTAQNFPLEVGFSLQELVDLGMYSTTSNAGRAIKDFFAQQKQTTLSGTVKKGKKTIKEEGGVLFYHYRLENGYVKLSVNENFNMEFIANYFTVFPRFAYALSNNAFNLVRYIFFLARQNTQPIKEKGTFTISLDAVRENLGLPAPDDVKNRKYRQYIIEPIEQAIEEIEDALKTAPEAKEYGFTITPVGTDTNSIHQWLAGYLEIGLKGDFAETFIKLATKTEEDREKWNRAKTRELAKLAAKKEIENT